MDEDIASTIYYELKNDDVRCFLMSKHTMVGNLADTVQSALIQSEYCIFLYGDLTEQSAFQRRELDLALQCGKKVYSIFLSSSDNEGVIHSILTKRTTVYTTLDNLCNHIRERVHSADRIDLEPQRAFVGKDGSKVSRPFKKRVIIWGLPTLLIIFFVPSFLTLFLYRASHRNYDDRIVSSSYDEIPDIDSIDYEQLEMIIGEEDAQTLRQIHEKRLKEEEEERLRQEEQLVYAPKPSPAIHWRWIIPVSVAVGVGILMIVSKKKKNIKLSSDVDTTVAIDGLHVAEINAGGVYATSLRKGEYLIDFTSNKDEHYRVVQKVSDRDVHVVLAEFLAKREIKFKCFIAGALTLCAERNALIAVVSKMYNRWEPEHFRISSHTFEDFTRDVVPGGQQILYNAFIENEADWCVFILTDGIGEKTLGEYRVAMDSLHKNGHPRILILASPKSEEDENLTAIKKEIIEANQYWNTCNNIEHMQSIFRDCVEWDITLLSKSRGRSL